MKLSSPVKTSGAFSTFTALSIEDEPRDENCEAIAVAAVAACVAALANSATWFNTWPSIDLAVYIIANHITALNLHRVARWLKWLLRFNLRDNRAWLCFIMFAYPINCEMKKITNTANHNQCTCPSADAPSMKMHITRPRLIDLHLQKGMNLNRSIHIEMHLKAMSPYVFSLKKLLKHLETPSMMYINSKNIPCQIISSLTLTVSRMSAMHIPWLSFNILSIWTRLKALRSTAMSTAAEWLTFLTKPLFTSKSLSKQNTVSFWSTRDMSSTSLKVSLTPLICFHSTDLYQPARSRKISFVQSNFTLSTVYIISSYPSASDSPVSTVSVKIQAECNHIEALRIASKHMGCM